jgi:hypothetical protein
MGTRRARGVRAGDLPVIEEITSLAATENAVAIRSRFDYYSYSAPINAEMRYEEMADASGVFAQRLTRANS